MTDAGYAASEGLLAPIEEPGIDPAELAEDELLRELASLHRTRLDTLRHAADSALATHLRRTAELETEYLARHPGREVDPRRLRDGADSVGADRPGG
jgi:Family of unknown function (DUF6158)